ncbi:MAG: hypothetical protein GYA45_03805 [Pelolinea sp.]|nr:hypothetical protein [Pelolinea sp.]
MKSKNDTDAKDHLVNSINLPIKEDDCILHGWDTINGFFCKRILDDAHQSPLTVGVDGYVGTDWQSIIKQLQENLERKGVSAVFIDLEPCLLSEQEINGKLSSSLGTDPIFGKIYHGNLIDFFDPNKLKQVRAEVESAKTRIGSRNRGVIVCYGSGALLSILRPLYDISIYCDLTRETAIARDKKWNQLYGKTQSIGPKKLYYVDMPVHDKHRNRLLGGIDYYLDGNNEESPVLISGLSLQRVTAALARMPFRMKYLYEPGPWGGQWLKKIRHLPSNWTNCAWSYEAIATEMSVLVQAGDVTIELPWTTFLFLQYNEIMGDVPKRRFHGQFPIRFDYLDTMDGGDLSIQVHPGTKYIGENFGEPYHQGEMYYIVEAQEGASVNLGLNENADLKEFKKAALRAEKEGIGFNYPDFVNHVPVKKNDLLMIPPGTVHGSGKGLVVLEVSATTYRYTFKIYDHLRPDLDGTMRPIHIEHAFRVIRSYRRSNWVRKNLIQEPRLIREGPGWKELLIGDRREFFHVVYRFEFDKQIVDDTQGNFHILTLVEGQVVELSALDDTDRKITMNYSETVIIPACLGGYTIVNQGEGKCKVVKSRLR